MKEIEDVTTRVKELADRKKFVYDDDLLTLVSGAPAQRARLVRYQVVSGNDLIPTATVEIEFDGERRTASAAGNGPLDAALKPAEAALGFDLELIELHTRALTAGTDALAEVIVRVRHGETESTGQAASTDSTDAALSVLGACLPFRLKEGTIGGAAIDATGDPLPQETLDLCRGSDAVFLGAVGGPRWDAGPVRPEDGLLRLRRDLGLYANLRPARYIGLPTPLRDGLARHADMLVVRELSGGVYFGEPRGISTTEAHNTWRQTAEEVRRVAHVAFRAARKRKSRVTSVDKANVLEVSRLWRAVVTEVGREYPDVELEHRHVDAASFEVLQTPHRFDVIVTDNLFGDILSDEVAAVVGSIGLLPSVSFGDGPSLYEPVHGSAPSLAGRGIANPTGAILTVSMLLEHSLGRPDLARVVEAAVAATLRDVRTPDIGGTATTEEFTGMVHQNLSWLRWAHSPEEPDEKTASYGWGV